MYFNKIYFLNFKKIILILLIKFNLGNFFFKNIFYKKKYFYFNYKLIKFKFFFNKILNYYDFLIIKNNINLQGFSLTFIIFLIFKFFDNKTINLLSTLNLNLKLLPFNKKILLGI